MLRQSAQPLPPDGGELTGKTIYIPPMAHGSARAFASAFRAIGCDARLTPPSDSRTLELGARGTSGDECYPAKVTLGDFMKVLEDPACDPTRVLLFMPTATGPCRFGQYSSYLRWMLDNNGYPDTGILSPSSSNGYGGLGGLAQAFAQTGWRGLLCADILQKLLLRFRPYELADGATDQAYEESLDDLCLTIERTGTRSGEQLRALHGAMVRSRDRFRGVPVSPRRDRPLIGVVGEIFCRLNSFSNDDVVRKLEEYGAEVWIADLTEWVWYTISEQFRKLRLAGRRFSREALMAWIRSRIQRRDEHRLLEPFQAEFAGLEEPHVEVLLECARPYLPADGALGEMVLSVGRAVHLAGRGADGIVDISPFTCMNGIVSEAIYPRLSRDHHGIPIRNFYFDGTESDLDHELGIYLDLARAHRRRRLAREGAGR